MECVASGDGVVVAIAVLACGECAHPATRTAMGRRCTWIHPALPCTDSVRLASCTVRRVWLQSAYKAAHQSQKASQVSQRDIPVCYAKHCYSLPYTGLSTVLNSQ